MNRKSRRTLTLRPATVATLAVFMLAALAGIGTATAGNGNGNGNGNGHGNGLGNGNANADPGTTVTTSTTVPASTTGNGNGNGWGRTKVTLCHKGKRTITVGKPAVKAHLRHGDTLGPCTGAAPTPGSATLIVIKHVVNDNGGAAAASAFKITIQTLTATGGNTFDGAEAPGTTKTLTTVGSYSVTEAAVTGYASTLSADCSSTIAAGQTKTCTITNDDIQPKLIVIKHVINDNPTPGTATAANFTMTVTGTSPSPASFPGAESPGTTVALNAGSYSVGETGPTGYTSSLSTDCSGSIAIGETKTCTVTNNDAPV